MPTCDMRSPISYGVVLACVCIRQIHPLYYSLLVDQSQRERDECIIGEREGVWVCERAPINMALAKAVFSPLIFGLVHLV
jgi:hypothetical protein